MPDHNSLARVLYPKISEGLPGFFRQLSSFTNSYRILPTIPTFLLPNRGVLFRYISSPFPDSHPPMQYPNPIPRPCWPSRAVLKLLSAWQQQVLRLLSTWQQKAPNVAHAEKDFFFSTVDICSKAIHLLQRDMTPFSTLHELLVQASRGLELALSCKRSNFSI